METIYGKDFKIFSLEEVLEYYDAQDFAKEFFIIKIGLGNYYENFKMFYKKILTEDNCFKKKINIFDNGTSLKMMMLFLPIIWKEANDIEKENMKKNWQYLQTNDFILKNEKETFTNFRFIFDIDAYGNKINETFDKFIKELGDTFFKYCNEEKNVFLRNREASKLKLSYMYNYNLESMVSFDMIFDLMHRIVTILSLLGKNSVNGAISVEISNDRCENLIKFGIPLENDKKVFSKSANDNSLFESYFYGFKGNETKYYCGLQAKNKLYDGKVIIEPFIFLPHLTSSSYEILKNIIFNRLGIKKNTLPSEKEQELIQLFLNQSLLTSWLKKTGISVDLKEFDITNAIIRFRVNNPNSKLSKDTFLRLLDENKLFSFKELTDVLNMITKDSQPLIVNQNGMKEPQIALEDEIFKIGMLEHIDAYGMGKCKDGFIKFVKSDACATKYCKNNWYISLNELLKKVSNDVKGNSVDEIMFSLVQLINSGVIKLEFNTICDNELEYITQTIRTNNPIALSLIPQRYSIFNISLDHSKISQLLEKLDEISKNWHQQGLIDDNIELSNFKKDFLEYIKVLNYLGLDAPIFEKNGLKIKDIVGYFNSSIYPNQIVSKVRMDYMEYTRLEWIASQTISEVLSQRKNTAPVLAKKLTPPKK